MHQFARWGIFSCEMGISLIYVNKSHLFNAEKWLEYIQFYSFSTLLLAVWRPSAIASATALRVWI